MVPIETIWRTLWAHYTPLKDDSGTVGIAKGAILQNVLQQAGVPTADSITQRLATLFIHRAVPLVFAELMSKKQKACDLVDETQSIYYLRHLSAKEIAERRQRVPPMPDGFKASLKTELREVLMGRKSAQQLVEMSGSSRSSVGKRAATMPANGQPASKKRKRTETDGQMERATTVQARSGSENGRKQLEPDSSTLVIDESDEDDDIDDNDREDADDDNGSDKDGNAMERESSRSRSRSRDALSNPRGRENVRRRTLGAASAPSIMAMPSSFATVADLNASDFGKRAVTSSRTQMSRSTASSATVPAPLDMTSVAEAAKTEQKMLMLTATIVVMQQELAAIKDQQKRQEEEWSTVFTSMTDRLVALEGAKSPMGPSNVAGKPT